MRDHIQRALGLQDALGMSEAMWRDVSGSGDP